MKPDALEDSAPVASIIIPTYQRPGSLRRLLTCLASQTLPATAAEPAAEVIVVDDGGRESLHSVIDTFSSRLSVTLVEQANQGPGAARNHGAQMARSQLLVFIDDDCTPAPGWLAELINAHRQRPEAVLGGPVENILVENVYSSTSQLIVEAVYERMNDADETRFLTTNNLAVPASRFRELGGFNPRFRTAEDREFCERWRAAGRRLQYIEEAKVFHAHQLGLLGFLQQHFNYGRGAWDFHASGVAGSVRDSLRFHRGIQNWLAQPFRKQARSPLRVAALLVVWQIANGLGLLRQMVSSAFAPSSRRAVGVD